MVQLGFVIDHSRCIGCHACTVACKSENDVPLGTFRTWVKYTEAGEFPEVKRSFAVLRCNQCTDAPCVAICPVTALDKGVNGIVDVDPDQCIGCKACMHGCPYDALYINPDKGTAEKCHFCAHRVEVGLAPACAVVCPTEAIIPGDFDDPSSRVSRMKSTGGLKARKVEAGTGPNVFYRDVTAAGIDPALTSKAGGYLWAQSPSGLQVDAQNYEAMERRATGQPDRTARTTYDVPRDTLWGSKITGYLFAKSLAAGVFPVAFFALGSDGELDGLPRPGLIAPLLSIVFLAITGLLLIADLKRPERFYKIIIRPNWSSWLARGTYIIMAYGALLGAWAAISLLGIDARGPFGTVMGWVTGAFGLATAAYTGWLFAQAKGRVLWMKRGLWLHLCVQALLAGAAVLALLHPFIAPAGDEVLGRLNLAFAVTLGLQLAMLLLEERCAPRGREAEYHRAVRLVTKGPFAQTHWGIAVAAGVALPLGLLAIQMLTGDDTLGALAGGLALAGLWVAEDVFVHAGQALPIS